MKDRFKFRAWYYDKDDENDSDNNKMFYNAQDTYDCLGGNPPLIASSFGDIIDDERWVVEQCTGLKDKNGDLIYEGDIIVKSDVSAIGYSRTRACKVHWHNDWLSWAITTQYGDTYELSEFEPQQYEIIGNIHENADLLENEE